MPKILYTDHKGHTLSKYTIKKKNHKKVTMEKKNNRE